MAVGIVAVASSSIVACSRAPAPPQQAEANGVAEPELAVGEVAAPPTTPATGAPSTSTSAAAAAPAAADPVVAGTDDSSTTSTAAAVPAHTVPANDARYSVLVTTFTFVDSTRTTPGRSDVRTLPTTVRYPNAPGAFPLVVFGHGYAASAGEYAPLLDDLASLGFVVAAPEFPSTSTAQSAYVNEGDVINQPGDMSFVATQVMGQSSRTGPLPGRVQTGGYLVMGHSDGAVTAAAAAYNNWSLDRRIRGAALLSGQVSGFGSVWFPVGSPPMLAVHGTNDTVNPYGRSQAMFSMAPSPKFLLTVPGGGHVDSFLSDRTRSSVVRVIADFFVAELYNDASSANRIISDATSSGVLQIDAA